MSKPKVLLYDLESAPLLADIWSIWQEGVSLNQVKKDWHLLSYAAKWLGDPPSKIMYKDQRNAKDISNDKELCKSLWKLLDEADVVIGQNSNSFDNKVANARFIMHDLPPPSSYKKVDTKLLAKRHFRFTSNRLEYLSDKLCTKYKKQKHRQFPGHEMWSECMKGNIRAWKAMEKYNKYDVLSLEELYLKLRPWGDGINWGIYDDTDIGQCSCGSTKFESKGFAYTNAGKYRRYRCIKCGKEGRRTENLLSKDKRKNMLRGV